MNETDLDFGHLGAHETRRHSTVGDKGPWRIRLARFLLRLLGVKVRVEYRSAVVRTKDDPRGEWRDGQARVSYGTEECHAEARPFLYAVTAKDRRWNRQLRADKAAFKERDARGEVDWSKPVPMPDAKETP